MRQVTSDRAKRQETCSTVDVDGMLQGPTYMLGGRKEIVNM